MPDTLKKKYTLLKWIAAISLSALILIAGLAWYLNVKSRPILTSRIKTLLYQSTDSLYKISFSKVSTNVLTGSATLYNVKITPDINRYNQLVALKKAPNNLYSVSLKKLQVKHFHPLTLYRHKKLQLEELIFDKPEVVMVNKQLAFNDNRPPRPFNSPYKIISKNLNEFSIGNIYFKDASFKYVNKNIAHSEPFIIDDLNITLHDLLVDSTSIDDPDRFYLLKDIIINLRDYNYPTPDKMYNIKVNQLDFKASTGNLIINKFEVAPLYGEMQFGKVAGYSKDRFQAQMSDMVINGIDLPLFISKQEFRAKEMTINNGSMSVFNDNSLGKKNSPSDSVKISVRRFPHQLLQRMDVPVLIQKIKLNDVNINYAVYNGESQQRGKISFEHTSGTFKNVTNLDKIKAINPFMEVDLKTYLFGQGELDLNFKFNLVSKNGDFAYKGQLHTFNARVLNQITKPLGLVRINRGIVDKLKFDFSANNDGAKGTVGFYYYDLSVALMRNDPTKDHLVTRGLLSILANALIINSENPDRNGKFTSASVNYQRIDNTSFFNLMWRSLFIGIQHSIGITEEKTQEIKMHIKHFQQMKESRRLRKQKRMQRKQTREREQALNRLK